MIYKDDDGGILDIEVWDGCDEGNAGESDWRMCAWCAGE